MRTLDCKRVKKSIEQKNLLATTSIISLLLKKHCTKLCVALALARKPRILSLIKLNGSTPFEANGELGEYLLAFPKITFSRQNMFNKWIFKELKNIVSSLRLQERVCVWKKRRTGRWWASQIIWTILNLNNQTRFVNFFPLKQLWSNLINRMFHFR